MNPANPTSSNVVSPPTKRRKMQSGSETKKGCTILLTGLAKSGKSSISNSLTHILKSNGIPVKQLDGKQLRAGLCKNLDFNQDKDKSEFVHIASETAKLFNEEGYIAIISIVAPLNEHREKARASHDNDGLSFVDVYVDRAREDCDAETRMSRNVMQPIDINYQPTTNPDVHLKRIGNNVDELTRQLVAKLVSYNVIPQHLTQPQSPFSPPNQPTPSPSTTLDSSRFDLDDDIDNDVNVTLKLPTKGSDLRAVFDHVKAALVLRGFVGKDEELDQHPLFFDMMKEWKTWYDTKQGKERFYPVKIPKSTKRKSTTPKKNITPTATTPKKDVKSPAKDESDGFISLYWSGSTIYYGQVKPGDNFPQAKKCVQCWKSATSLQYSMIKYHGFTI